MFRLRRIIYVFVLVILNSFLLSCNLKEKKSDARERFEKRRKAMKIKKANIPLEKDTIRILEKDTASAIHKIKNYDIANFEGAWGELGFPYAEFVISGDSLEYVENLGRLFICKISVDTFYIFYKDTLVHTNIIKELKNDTLILPEEGKYEYQYYKLH